MALTQALLFHSKTASKVNTVLFDLANLMYTPGKKEPSMRRKDSEITEKAEMIRILESTNIGRLATIDKEGYPYITPVNFIFYDGCVYFHCALEGEKLNNIGRCPKVCF